ncbi:hypothetical protein BC827DRAFT_43933 [Russula dissimulans]|nr:hypothetical protein BC827DRAFT_43933 [Russula dissimulans]
MEHMVTPAFGGCHRTQGCVLLHTCVSPHAADGQVGRGGSLRTPHMVGGHDNSGSTEPKSPKQTPFQPVPNRPSRHKERRPGLVVLLFFGDVIPARLRGSIYSKGKR